MPDLTPASLAPVARDAQIPLDSHPGWDRILNDVLPSRERGPAAVVVPASGPRDAARAAEASAWDRALTHEQEPERWDGME